MKNKPNTTRNHNGRSAEPVAPPPTFPTQTLYFDDLPSVALIIPDPTNLTQLVAYGAEISRQLAMKAINIVAEQVAQAQQPAEKILPPEDEPAGDASAD